MTTIDGLRRESNREYEQTAGGYMQTTFRKCADSGKEGGRDGHAENVQLEADDD